MEDLGFHRKYRPKKLSEYVGNEKLKESVRKALQSEKKPQVILLSGPAGTGKTTMARLLAKEYLCEDRDIETGACNECYTCKAMNEFIETGCSDYLTNIREVDVTDSNKKQDIEDILNDAAQPSFNGNWKIYILDECHMMTSSAQNRLLKTLEEPPEKVLMILCTTNPEKLLDTIVSRCQYKFVVKKPTMEELTGLLKRVCQNEKINWNQGGLKLVATKGDFVPRKALIELDNVIREGKECTREAALKVLNIVSDKYYFEFFSILTEKYIDVTKYIGFLGRIKQDMDLKAYIDSLIPFMLRGIYVANGQTVEALDPSELEQYKKLFKKFSVEDLAYLLDTLIRIKDSNDVEARLILLGYQGIRPLYAKQENTVELVDNSRLSAIEEKKAGQEEFEKSQKISEESKVEIIEGMQRKLSSDKLATNFSSGVYTGKPIGDIERPNINIIMEE